MAFLRPELLTQVSHACSPNSCDPTFVRSFIYTKLANGNACHVQTSLSASLSIDQAQKVS